MAACFGLLADTGALLSIRSAFLGTGVKRGDGGKAPTERTAFG